MQGQHMLTQREHTVGPCKNVLQEPYVRRSSSVSPRLSGLCCFSSLYTLDYGPTPISLA